MGICFDTCHAHAVGHRPQHRGGLRARVRRVRAHDRDRPAARVSPQRLQDAGRQPRRPPRRDRRRLPGPAAVLAAGQRRRASRPSPACSRRRTAPTSCRRSRATSPACARSSARPARPARPSRRRCPTGPTRARAGCSRTDLRQAGAARLPAVAALTNQLVSLGADPTSARYAAEQLAAGDARPLLLMLLGRGMLADVLPEHIGPGPACVDRTLATTRGERFPLHRRAGARAPAGRGRRRERSHRCRPLGAAADRLQHREPDRRASRRGSTGPGAARRRGRLDADAPGRVWRDDGGGRAARGDHGVGSDRPRRRAPVARSAQVPGAAQRRSRRASSVAPRPRIREGGPHLETTRRRRARGMPRDRRAPAWRARRAHALGS